MQFQRNIIQAKAMKKATVKSVIFCNKAISSAMLRGYMLTQGYQLGRPVMWIDDAHALRMTHAVVNFSFGSSMT